MTEEPTERIFYDGDCGVCHWSVAFVARHDRTGRAFRFAPLGGETFEAELAAPEREGLPDSIVVRTAGGAVLVRSRGLLHILKRLGRFWRAVGAVLWLVPRPLRDLGYDGFAAIRHRLVRRPDGSCPLMPPELGRRFDP